MVPCHRYLTGGLKRNYLFSPSRELVERDRENRYIEEVNKRTKYRLQGAERDPFVTKARPARCSKFLANDEKTEILTSHSTQGTKT